MDSSRTRFLLRAMRPNGADHADPTFREALALTHADPELRAWFEREQAVDRAITSKLRELRAPAELRAHILQGVALSTQKKSRRPWALLTASLAAAASLAMVIYTLWPAARRPLASFDLMVTAAVRETAQRPDLAFSSNSGAEIQTWLESNSLPVPGVMPGQLGAQEILGGGMVEWQGVTCSLVTLRAPMLTPGAPAAADAGAHNTSDSTLVHLYTIPRRSCSTQGVGRTPLIATREDATVATWRDAVNNYVLVARASLASMQALLGPEARLAQAALTGDGDHRRWEVDRKTPRIEVAGPRPRHRDHGPDGAGPSRSDVHGSRQGLAHL